MTIWHLLSSPEYSQRIILQRLLCDALQISREEMRTSSDKEVWDRELAIIKKWYDDYVINKKPLEYILGKVTFFDNNFFVNEDTLVPRPETEYMIQAVREFIEQHKDTTKNILLDVWTWCWVLWTSVLLQNPDYFQSATFSDISDGAIEVAKRNYKNLVADHNVSPTPVTFVKSDLVAYLDQQQEEIKDANIILVANLPYIPDATFDNNAPANVQNREPRMAFVWGDDWLDYYRIMFKQITKLNEETLKSFHFSILPYFNFFMEMMTRQVDILRQEFAWILDFEEIKTFHFNIRIVYGKFVK